MRAIYIAWINYQRRAESMQKYFGYDVFYVSNKYVSRPFRLLGYLQQAKRTIHILVKERPDVVWLQLPPNFLTHLLMLSRFALHRPIKIVADCHNAALRAPWALVPFSTFLLNRADLVLVHNEDVRADARRLGIADHCLKVLGDCVPSFDGIQPSQAVPGQQTIVMPCSFHADEPIEIVLDAAKALPMATFVITGNRRKLEGRGVVERAPPNVVFPGFLPTQEFDRLLMSAAAVLCLTTEDGIQLSAATEAVAAGKPMVISNTTLLRRLFGEAGIFVDNTAEAIAAGCRDAIERRDEHTAAVRMLRNRRIDRWLTEAEPIRASLASA